MLNVSTPSGNQYVIRYSYPVTVHDVDRGPILQVVGVNHLARFLIALTQHSVLPCLDLLWPALLGTDEVNCDFTP